MKYDRIIFATGNAGKMREIKEIMKDIPIEVISMKDAKMVSNAEENGTTFEENAFIKAEEIATISREKKYNDIVIADDSGLEIDVLNKEPGIYSARYMGEDTPYHEKNMNLISRFEGIPDEKRTARFVCAIACILPDGTRISTRATIEGRIGYEEKGEGGFGYDPIFYVPEYNCSTAELTMEQKNKISHRGKALQQMKEQLITIF